MPLLTLLWIQCYLFINSSWGGECVGCLPSKEVS
ncbi:hypothetical protein GLYMA_12G187650v4 [Glycine max]|nr:hypothetical protein GLYMA_12G187650v4 [Glycine max]KAH1143872.1 hypothetical protein GYH30_034208 [Glycine max]